MEDSILFVVVGQAIADGVCNVRGWIGNREVEGDVKTAVGKGTLQVVKNHPSWRIPYNGVVELANGEVAPDVAFYLATSEQRNTAIGVGVSMRSAEEGEGY